MEYILKHFDTPLFRFTANADSADPEYQITWFDEAHRELLPGDITAVSEGELDRWIRQRGGNFDCLWCFAGLYKQNGNRESVHGMSSVKISSSR